MLAELLGIDPRRPHPLESSASAMKRARSLVSQRRHKLPPNIRVKKHVVQGGLYVTFKATLRTFSLGEVATAPLQHQGELRKNTFKLISPNATKCRTLTIYHGRQCEEKKC